MIQKAAKPRTWKGQRIGRILTAMGKITRQQVQETLELQTKRRAPLSQLLVELGYVTQEDVKMALAIQAGIKTIDLEDREIHESILQKISPEMAQAYQILPIDFNKNTNTLTVAIKNPDNFGALDDLRLLMGFNVTAKMAPASQINKLLGRYYSNEEETVSSILSEMVTDDKLEAFGDRSQSIDLDALIEAAEDNKVKRLLNLVLLQAIKDKASDIHLEPFEKEFKMRYRMDGVLYEMIPPPKYLALPIVSRVKVMANLDIAEHRVPQDGRIELTVHDRPVDLRVSVLPTMFGESVVMRVLDRSNVSLDLEQVGLRADDLDTFRQLIKKPNGIVIVTGPTGSGKTTTLYSGLNELNDCETKILTAEDPVEYDVDGLVQVQINTATGLTFASALRSFLRQDPDIILVGETRDLETAQIAVQASLTGHLVFTTLHTNDAPSAVARLVDLGLESFLLTATVEGIVAQRLVRKICLRCKQGYQPTEEQLMELNLMPQDIQDKQFYRGQGCNYCNMTGHKGRIAIFEILLFDDRIRELVMQNASTQALRQEARKSGGRTLRESGLLAIFEGLTTIEEVVRETILEE